MAALPLAVLGKIKLFFAGQEKDGNTSFPGDRLI
jgi:hypothetical protein